MKIKNLLFFLLASFVLVSCTSELETENYVLNRSYVEFTGVVDLSPEDAGDELWYGGSDQPELEKKIFVSWDYGHVIFFLSASYEFDVSNCKIWGGLNCCDNLFLADAQIKDCGKSYLYFEPDNEFWECLEYEARDPIDEIFHFDLMVREVE